MKTEEAFYKVWNGKTAYVCERVNAYKFVPMYLHWKKFVIYVKWHFGHKIIMALYWRKKNKKENNLPYRNKIASVWLWIPETGIHKKHNIGPFKKRSFFKIIIYQNWPWLFRIIVYFTFSFIYFGIFFILIVEWIYSNSVDHKCMQ